MKPNQFLRRNNLILDARREPYTIKDYKSINKAKKKSFQIQMKEDGALGRGSVARAKR